MTVFVRAYGSYDILHSRCRHNRYSPHLYIPKQLAEIESEITEEWGAYQKVWNSGEPNRDELKRFIKNLGLLRCRLVVHLEALNVSFEGIRHEADYKSSLAKIIRLSNILHQLILATAAMNDMNETRKSQKYLNYKNGDRNLEDLVRLYHHLNGSGAEFLALVVRLNKLKIDTTIHSTIMEKIAPTIREIDSELLIIKSAIFQQAALNTKGVQIVEKEMKANEVAMPIISSFQPLV